MFLYNVIGFDFYFSFLSHMCAVYYYNFGWSDYSVPTLATLLDAVKVLDHSVSLGRVAIHCHAGLGRTGLLIACHLIYSQQTPPNQAITHVRVKR